MVIEPFGREEVDTFKDGLVDKQLKQLMVFVFVCSVIGDLLLGTGCVKFVQLPFFEDGPLLLVPVVSFVVFFLGLYLNVRVAFQLRIL